MRNEMYRGCNIRSTPNRLAEEESGNYSVNGVIELNYGSHIIDVMTQNLNIPDDQWVHEMEEGADAVFLAFAKKYIDNNL